jgi:low affinity Fe/Cu permease
MGPRFRRKIDELIKASSKARDDLIGLEKRDEDVIERVRLDEGARIKLTSVGGKNSQKA